jgi:hypothetical protein
VCVYKKKTILKSFLQIKIKILWRACFLNPQDYFYMRRDQSNHVSDKLVYDICLSFAKASCRLFLNVSVLEKQREAIHFPHLRIPLTSAATFHSGTKSLQ